MTTDFMDKEVLNVCPTGDKVANTREDNCKTRGTITHIVNIYKNRLGLSPEAVICYSPMKTQLLKATLPLKWGLLFKNSPENSLLGDSEVMEVREFISFTSSIHCIKIWFLSNIAMVYEKSHLTYLTLTFVLNFHIFKTVFWLEHLIYKSKNYSTHHPQLSSVLLAQSALT